MGVAALLFGLLVGFFHFNQAPEVQQDQQMLAADLDTPAAYESSAALTSGTTELRDSAMTDLPPEGEAGGSKPEYHALAAAETAEQRAQAVADIVADQPGRAGKVVTIAMAQVYDDASLGEVSTLIAAATKAAPGEAAAIAGAVTRSLADRSDAALAAAIATIVSLVPEQARDVGLVVGAIVGEDAPALGMVAQTVAIATGEETFSSLSEGSGVSMTMLMKESTRLGVDVPYQVPAFAAAMAPSASQVADSAPESADAADGSL
ncbi:MAG: hypothetical protein V2I66_01360 [Halieaceae bacterium]|jgi:hypothetical protein|nr:hypothetical protein [Halieaceae bacterium]